MVGYKFVEHTSDIIIEANGNTFSKAFENLAEGMFTQMGAKGQGAEESEQFRYKAEANTLEELVVNSLSEILAETEIARFTPTRLKVGKFDKEEKSLEFIVYGEGRIPRNIIKAVTFHELIVKEDREKGGWTIRVLFDI